MSSAPPPQPPPAGPAGPAAAAPEDCKLFVYGVSIRTAREELQAEFEKFGQVLDAYNSGKG